MLEIITAIAVACVPLLAAWITATVIPWVKARTTAEQRRALRELVKELVYSAEQLYRSGVIEDRLTYVQGRLEAQNIKKPVEDVRDLVEEAVLELTIREEWALGHGTGEEIATDAAG